MKKIIKVKIKNNKKMELFIKAERIEKKLRKLKPLLLSKKNLAVPEKRKMIFKFLNMQELTLNFIQDVLNQNKF